MSMRAFSSQRAVPSHGFTLVELLVAVSLFTVVVTISTGTLMALIDANNRAQAMDSIINNVSITVDHMVRDIRTGSGYTCRNINETLPNPGGAANQLDLDVASNNDADPRNCENGANAIGFTESGGSLTESGGCTDNNRIGFRHYVNSDGQGSIQRNLCDQGWEAITAPEVNITELTYIVTGAEQVGGPPAPDDLSPVVVVKVAAEVSEGAFGGADTSFALQTTVTQREIDR